MGLPTVYELRVAGEYHRDEVVFDCYLVHACSRRSKGVIPTQRVITDPLARNYRPHLIAFGANLTYLVML